MIGNSFLFSSTSVCVYTNHTHRIISSVFVAPFPHPPQIKLRGAASEWDIFEVQATKEESTQAIAIEGFEVAKSLDFFRNIDPNKFEWVNKSEIQPGETTCGFLKAPLVWNGDSGFPEEGDTIYPTVDVCK